MLHGHTFADLDVCQHAFDRFRPVYNTQRPHEALGLAVPTSHYHARARAFPETLPAVHSDPADHVRQVQQGGWISFGGRTWRVPKAFAGQAVALRPTEFDGRFDLVFIAHKLGQIDPTQPAKPDPQPVTYVPEEVLPLSSV